MGTNERPGVVPLAKTVTGAFAGLPDGAFISTQLSSGQSVSFVVHYTASTRHLYGTANIPAGGIVQVQRRSSTGAWTERVLYTFQPATGFQPSGPLAFDSSGNLYGTTYYGGDSSCYDGFQGGCGVVFKLSPTASGWVYKVLFTFSQQPYTLAYPVSGVILDKGGNLYGIASGGMAMAEGAFKVTAVVEGGPSAMAGIVPGDRRVSHADLRSDVAAADPLSAAGLFRHGVTHAVARSQQSCPPVWRGQRGRPDRPQF